MVIIANLGLIAEHIIEKYDMELVARHIARLKEGLCTVDQGMIFTDLLSDCRRVSDHCSNVAAAMIELNRDSYDTHHYLGDIKENDAAFKERYEAFLAQYPLP